DQARHRSGEADEICACYEAGYDGFWIHRALIARGVVSTVLDSASIQVSRRGRRVKTDRTDAESLVRVLMALYRGEHQVAKIVQVPSPDCYEAAAIYYAIASGTRTAFGGCLPRAFGAGAWRHAGMAGYTSVGAGDPR